MTSKPSIGSHRPPNWLIGQYVSRTQKWGSETVGWIARQANFLRTWETERCVDRLF
ncbi:hypothetical protein HFO41_12550 [Rhizobium leguminosarum]|nr:hypothetical protein [Rhizobium leguminosarum]MBY5554291.1 hypothetical protein [Rhizobium leguminosarum]MBY5584954.1 hypothetical protein [Rhizobium leguminosarum]MBY5636707.1 hypothetical protein [Rhizobium leguminosarum]MBY5689649.1 hypothetical protein [Rhizobium leguminosarum]MBY5721924.1 hypothetical protein [Rhizobium leguminosarum]